MLTKLTFLDINPCHFTDAAYFLNDYKRTILLRVPTLLIYALCAQFARTKFQCAIRKFHRTRTHMLPTIDL